MSLKIKPVTLSDALYHRDESEANCLRWITRQERVPGRFSWREASSDPEVSGFALIATAITITLGLLISIPVGIIVSSGNSFIWFWLYLICLPTAIFSLLFWWGVFFEKREIKSTWHSRRRYAYSKGWLAKYELDVELHKGGLKSSKV